MLATQRDTVLSLSCKHGGEDRIADPRVWTRVSRKVPEPMETDVSGNPYVSHVSRTL